MVDEPRVRRTSQARSTAKQDAMREAAARLLIEEGPDTVTHRRVAAAAGVPAGSASYYFPSREVLYTEAVRAAEELRATAATATARAVRRRPRGARRTARLMLEVLFAPELEPDVVVKRLQPMLAATADPGLQPIMAETRPRLLGALREVLVRSGWSEATGEPDVALLASLLDATLLYGAATGDDDPIEDAVTAVGRVLELMRTAHGD